jgi:hypothetical protein
MIIDGVPAVNAGGAGNNPSVSRSSKLSVATNDLDTAAYNTLHSPVLIATMFPNNVDVPE